VLDPKGELYDQTAYLFRNVYRIDLQTPGRSDRWNFLPDCGGNAEFAHKVASMILDSEQSRRSTADPFWKEAEKAALTAILLQLNQLHPRPAPHMIQELISTLTLAATQRSDDEIALTRKCRFTGGCSARSSRSSRPAC
jgi:hypothetical protein